MRGIALFICALLLAFSGGPASAQSGYDRRGGDYTSFQIRSGDPAVCATRCERDGRCRAWAFAYPERGRLATCWLKNQVPPVIEDKCCVSGVRGAGVAEPRQKALEYSIDRFGGDYRTVDVAPGAREAECQKACEGDNRCRAWTFVRPGYISSAARCYLKDKLTRPRHKPCCISGVVR